MHRRQVIKLGAAALMGSSAALLHEPTLTLAATHTHEHAQQPHHKSGTSLTDFNKLLHFFTIRGGNVYRTSQVNFGRDTGWTPWYNHGSPTGSVILLSNPLLSSNQPLRLYALAGQLPSDPSLTATTLSLYYLELNSLSGVWSGWQSLTPAHTLKTFVSHCSMTTGKTANNLPTFFITGSTTGSDAFMDYMDGQSWSSMTLPPDAGKHDVISLATASGADGRQELFAIIGTILYHKWQWGPNAAWSDWYAHEQTPDRGLGLSITSVQVATNADGRLELCVMDSGGYMYHKWQVAPSGGFTTWSYMGHPSQDVPNDIALNRHADGRLVLFQQWANGAYHIEQTAPNGGWSDWISHGLATPNHEPFVVGMCSTQNMLVYLNVDIVNNNFNYLWQTAPNSSDWGSWLTLAHP